jgi:para-nitrobenzyl esterase
MYGAGSDTTAENVQRLVNEKRMVVVTINYRLGVFGFLGSERLRLNVSDVGSYEGAQTGNMGTLDQHLALRWVNTHIEHFGGDASKISVIGWSAGAASASVHLSMPVSRGLFTKAVMLSGAFTDWAAQTMADAEADYDLLVEKANCHREPECQAKGPPCACLLALPAEELNRLQQQVPITWAPTVDGAALPLHPIDALEQGQVAPGVPIVIGSALEDTTTVINDQATDAQFAEFLGTILPADSVRAVERMYMGSDPFNKQKLGRSAAYWAVRRLKADKTMTCPARSAARRWRAATGAPAYWYMWATADPRSETWPSPQSLRHAPEKLEVGGCWPCPGAGHGSDLPFVFDTGDVHVENAMSDLADVVQTFYRDFADTGDPSNWHGFTFAKDGQKAWEEASKGGLQFKAGDTRFLADLRGEQCDFWDKIGLPKP